jgi:hypothetical protein
MEIVVSPDGAVRVFGEKVAGLTPVAAEMASEALAWNEETKAKPPKTKRRGEP